MTTTIEDRGQARQHLIEQFARHRKPSLMYVQRRLFRSPYFSQDAYDLHHQVTLEFLEEATINGRVFAGEGEQSEFRRVYFSALYRAVRSHVRKASIHAGESHCAQSLDELMGPYMASTPKSSTQSPEQLAMAREESRIIATVVSQQSPVSKLSWSLRYLDGFSTRDIAHNLRIPIRSVNTRIFRVDTAIRKKMLSFA